jgi:NADH dehydrogenase (ubiquinone) 1 alpha subcomplex subunit 8
MCKAQSEDPAACLSQGQNVTRCASGVLTNLSTKCSVSFMDYRKCLESNRRNFRECRDVELQLRACYEAAKKA